MVVIMRCHKMHATITVKRCMANQEARGGFNVLRNNEDYDPRYPGCKDCGQGVLAAKGKLDDVDVEELKQRISEERGETEMKRYPVVDGKKKCSKCDETKSIEEFSRKVAGSEAPRSVCQRCYSKYQAEWRAQKTEMKSKRVQEEPTPTKVPAPACIQEANVPETNFGNKELADDLPKDEHVLILDFSVYPQVLDEIKRLANDQERPPEVQARYMLCHIMRGSDPPWRILDLGYHFDKGENTL